MIWLLFIHKKNRMSKLGILAEGTDFLTRRFEGFILC